MGVEKGGRKDRWEEEGEGGEAIGKFKYEIICNNFFMDQVIHENECEINPRITGWLQRACVFVAITFVQCSDRKLVN